MKQLFAFVIVMAPFMVNAQADTTKTEQYCDVQVTIKMFTKKIAVSIDYGKDVTINNESKVKDEGKVLQSFTNTVDIINYMARQGWQLVTATGDVPTGSNGIYHFYFKRKFLQAQLL